MDLAEGQCQYEASDSTTKPNQNTNLQQLDPPPAIHYRSYKLQLFSSERDRQNPRGFTSTVCHELRRNGIKRKNYCYVVAQRHAESREWQGFRIALDYRNKSRRSLAKSHVSQVDSCDLCQTGVGGFPLLGNSLGWSEIPACC